MDLKERLNHVIKKDKENNPQFLINVIKSDFYYLINNYFEVDFEDIEIDISIVNDKYNVTISSQGDRIKMMRTLPQ